MLISLILYLGVISRRKILCKVTKLYLAAINIWAIFYNSSSHLSRTKRNIVLSEFLKWRCEALCGGFESFNYRHHINYHFLLALLAAFSTYCNIAHVVRDQTCYNPNSCNPLLKCKKRFGCYKMRNILFLLYCHVFRIND